MPVPTLTPTHPLAPGGKPSKNELALRRLLKSSPQDLWLETLRRTRGPEHCNLVYWMLNQPECDFAVAMHAFYRCNPTEHLDNPRPLPTRPGTHDIFALILQNWDTGSYRTHRLMIDPVDADPRLVSRVKQKLLVHKSGSLPFKIPEQFLSQTGGTAVRVPANLHPNDVRHIWSLFTALGLKVHESPPGLARKLAQLRWLFGWRKSGARQA